MKTLRVVYAGWGERWLLGTLADDGRRILFEYSDEARRAGLELSPLRLPLAHPGAFTGEPFFMGLPGLVADALPDGWGLLLMDRAFRRAGRAPEQVSPLDRLAFIGERAMGALIFEPAEPLALPDENLALLRLAEDAAQVLSGASGEADATLRRLLLLGGSPQGARPKVLVDFDQTRRRIASGGQHDGMAPWLVKFPGGGEHRDACAIEELHARLARHCGIDMPESRFFALDGRHAAFGVRRFDREGGRRAPLLSLSAALHVDYRLPALDYETLLRATRRLTGDEREVVKAFERCVFNVLAHNRDDHARNFAFRLDRERRWRLAPAFDLTFSPGPGGEHHTTVAGEGRAPGREHLLELARRSGVPLPAAQAGIDRILEGMSAFEALAQDLPIRKTRLAELRRVLAEDNRRVRQ
ncbi:MAG: type II toxin-antitoxin system HipA family toxin [Sulfurisoma sp.]|nr:type II toxin-antitoxin system HipA family toxin [Sulfurisoma sp.]